MKSFKKFVVAIAIIAALSAALCILVNYLNFVPDKDDADTSALTQFLDKATTSAYIKTALLFMIAAVAGILTQKFAIGGVAISIIPVVYIFSAHLSLHLEDMGGFFILLSLAYFIGELIFFVQSVRRDGFDIMKMFKKNAVDQKVHDQNSDKASAENDS